MRDARFKGFSLYHRLLIAFIGIVVAVSGTLTLIFYAFSSNSLENRAKEIVQQELDMMSFRLETDLRHLLVTDTQVMVSNPVVDQYLASPTIYKAISTRAVERLFRQAIAHSRSYRSISYVDPTGREVIRVEGGAEKRARADYSRYSVFRRLMADDPGQVVIEGPFEEPRGHYSLRLGMSKTDPDIGRFGGAVFVVYSLDDFLSELGKVSILGENPVWLLSPSGDVLRAPASGRAILDPRPFLTQDIREEPVLFASRHGLVASRDISVVPRHPLMRLVISVPATLMFQDLRSTLRFLFLVFLASLAAIALLAFVLSRYLSRPVIELARATLRLADGDRSARVTVKTTGEVQTLVDNFNRMASDLQSTTVSREYMDNLVHSLADALVVTNRDLAIKTVNQAAADLFGFRGEELAGRRIDSVLAGPGDGRDVFAELARKGSIGNVEVVCRTKGGREIPLLISGAAVRESGGGPADFVIVGKDISERKRAEEAIRSERDKTQMYLDVVNAIMVALDAAGRVTLINRKGCEILGYGEGEILGRNWFDAFIPPDQKNEVRAVFDGIMAGGGIPAEYHENTIRTRDGGLRTIAWHNTLLRDEEGRPAGTLSSGEDVTVRKTMEEEIAKSQKLESLGVLAGGIAHDFNNYLTAILGNIALARFSMNPGDKAWERLLQAEKATNRAKDLTQQMLTFSKGGAPIRKASSIGDLVRDSVSFILSGSNVKYEVAVPGDLLPVHVDEGQISQVVHNLVVNAREAMPQGGILAVACENTTVGPRDGLPLKARRYVRISVRDQGPGIPKELLQKIFDPYFTTKQRGGGLGLATVYSIVRNHDGHVAVDTEPGIGTVFSIYLPVSEEGPGIDRPAEKEIRTGKGRVLVMDDEEFVRDVVGEMLQGLGYEVAFAAEGREAIARYAEAEASSRPFDLVIMDLTIPGGMGGKETIRALIERFPGAKAIVSSGYSKDPVMGHHEKYGFRGVVSKPYTLEELSRTVETVIRTA